MASAAGDADTCILPVQVLVPAGVSRRLSPMQVHGKKAVVNFRQSASEIQWQPRNKRGASSSAETSCISFGEELLLIQATRPLQCAMAPFS